MPRHGIRSTEVREVLGDGDGKFGRVLHVVAADDSDRDETMVITSYEPNAPEWEPDLKTRRKP